MELKELPVIGKLFDKKPPVAATPPVDVVKRVAIFSTATPTNVLPTADTSIPAAPIPENPAPQPDPVKKARQELENRERGISAFMNSPDSNHATSSADADEIAKIAQQLADLNNPKV